MSERPESDFRSHPQFHQELFPDVYYADDNQEVETDRSELLGTCIVEYIREDLCLRTPTLPDVMEDGYVVASNAEHRIIVAIWGFANSDCWGVAYIAQEFYKDKWGTLTGIPPGLISMLCLPDLSKYKVQNGQIVKVEG